MWQSRRLAEELRDGIVLARSHTTDAIETLVAAMNSDSAPMGQLRAPFAQATRRHGVRPCKRRGSSAASTQSVHSRDVVASGRSSNGAFGHAEGFGHCRL